MVKRKKKGPLKPRSPTAKVLESALYQQRIVKRSKAYSRKLKSGDKHGQDQDI